MVIGTPETQDFTFEYKKYLIENKRYDLNKIAELRKCNQFRDPLNDEIVTQNEYQNIFKNKNENIIVNLTQIKKSMDLETQTHTKTQTQQIDT